MTYWVQDRHQPVPPEEVPFPHVPPRIMWQWKEPAAFQQSPICRPKHVQPSQHSVLVEFPKGCAVSLFTVTVHAGESDADGTSWMGFGEVRDKLTAFVARRKWRENFDLNCLARKHWIKESSQILSLNWGGDLFCGFTSYPLIVNKLCSVLFYSILILSILLYFILLHFTRLFHPLLIAVFYCNPLSSNMCYSVLF